MSIEFAYVIYCPIIHRYCPLVQVRAATSLLAITHSLKLLLLLSDEHEIAVRRDEASVKLTERMEVSRRIAAERLDGLLNSLSKEKGDMELDVE